MWPPTADEVMRELRITTIDADQRTVLEDSLAAAVDYVEDNRPDMWLDVGEPPVLTFTESPRVHRGTVRYAGRIYTRAVNPGGIDPVTGLGAPSVYSLDVDIANLLGVRSSRMPSVG